MSDGATEARPAYPYLTTGQWFAVRAKMKQSLPRTVDIDWLMATLGTSEKGARNLLPQLKATGLVGADGTPTAVARDFRDDDEYATACRTVLEAVYPETLRNAYDDPEADPTAVANWFMRNAGTGAASAKMQARLYLALLGGKLPSGEAAAKAPRRKPTATPKVAPASPPKEGREEVAPENDATPKTRTQTHSQQGPNLHIDLQIHIAADAGDAQIESIFASMAKHLYGRE